LFTESEEKRKKPNGMQMIDASVTAFYVYIESGKKSKKAKG